MAQLSKSQLQAIKANPIRDELDSFRDTLKSTFPDANAQGSPLSFEGLAANSVGRSLSLRLIGILQLLPAASALSFEHGGSPLSADIALLYARLSSNQTDFRHTTQLAKDVNDRAEDPIIWSAVLDLIARTRPTLHPTTPPQSAASFAASFQQTPWSFNTGSFADTSDLRKDVDPILKGELEGNLIVDHPHFFDTFFGGVPQLSEMAAAVFERCKEAETPLHTDDTGWAEWPEDCAEPDVLHWLRHHIDQFLQFANEQGFQPPARRRCFATPNKPIPGSVSKRKLDIGIIYGRRNETSDDGAPCDWFDVLVPGELKGNPREDNHSSTWFDLSRYAREIFAAQDTRRSVTGFTLCGSIMRLWAFDRLGAVASQSFDIHENALMFISAVLGYLWMAPKDLGFDPTICGEKGSKYIEITRNAQPERYHLDDVIKRQRCVAGRATSCWEVHNAAGQPFVVKDSWEFEERPEEGPLLKKVTDAGVKNVAEYHYHEIVHDEGAVVDVRNNLRKGLGDGDGRYPLRGHPNSQLLAEFPKPEAPASERLMSGRGRSNSITRKRRSNSRHQSMRPPKRSCSDSPTKGNSSRRNRVHRRLIMGRVGKSIYDASSLVAMITGILGGIKGHESLLERNVLHRDISVGNIMLEKDEDDGFLIDLDLAIEMDRKEASGAPSKTGTKVFMAIGALYGEHHNFMHDLESFFWVLFWLCVHWNGPDQKRSRTEYESWNYKDTEELAMIKKGTVDEQDKFDKKVDDNFTAYCKPLIPCIKELREVVFPGGKRWRGEDQGLYVRMKAILEKARENLVLVVA
ncbi:uncharacterized protein BDZ99DRAFT_373500 [Mytilinidion resinicola]|uniref:non-specific serine/threonine protein kinase n=1 Tax=Mytilinidion resinicola TaxID=574789 RepID=A0A6A6ZBG8_9PEZI|nr:uncharacterized protein BDZ99DRAFT_373500 [Mytilinidion resinicola]KAF2817567.1 hypothetical protein BDZ99DRAFT_373500 [Mytilinidion resinicola]